MSDAVPAPLSAALAAPPAPGDLPLVLRSQRESASVVFAGHGDTLTGAVPLFVLEPARLPGAAPEAVGAAGTAVGGAVGAAVGSAVGRAGGGAVERASTGSGAQARPPEGAILDALRDSARSATGAAPRVLLALHAPPSALALHVGETDPEGPTLPVSRRSRVLQLLRAIGGVARAIRAEAQGLAVDAWLGPGLFAAARAASGVLPGGSTSGRSGHGTGPGAARSASALWGRADDARRLFAALGPASGLMIGLSAPTRWHAGEMARTAVSAERADAAARLAMDAWDDARALFTAVSELAGQPARRAAVRYGLAVDVPASGGATDRSYLALFDEVRRTGRTAHMALRPLTAAALPRVRRLTEAAGLLATRGLTADDAPYDAHGDVLPGRAMATRLLDSLRGAWPIDLESADAALLARVPGIGPTAARAVVQARGTGTLTQTEDLVACGVDVTAARPWLAWRGFAPHPNGVPQSIPRLSGMRPAGAADPITPPSSTLPPAVPARTRGPHSTTV